MATQGDPTHVLGEALRGLRAAVAGVTYPLPLPAAPAARDRAGAVLAQLDDYVLPRLHRMDAPLLVVVGGSTGAGKSTLVNSLVRAPVSPAGVLRPTTRAPVLVCHPADIAWFRGGELLPGLARDGHPGAAGAAAGAPSLHLVAAPALIPGLAFLDAPDIDSVVDANRALAGQLLAAADLWLFLTTAARYADAVPWQVLRAARDRGTVVALVLDRVPEGATDEVAGHLGQMLAAHGLADAPLFVLPETRVDGQGLLPEPVVAGLRNWFASLAADAAARSAVVRQTLDGAIAALHPAVFDLAAAAEDQLATAEALAETVGEAYGGARSTIEQGVRDGTLLRGEVLARWQEFVGTGEWMQSLQAAIARGRDRAVAAITGRPVPVRDLSTALRSSLLTLVHAAAADAGDRVQRAWRSHPVGTALLTGELAMPSPTLMDRIERMVRDWQYAVLELVRAEGADRRVRARSAAYAVNATGFVVLVAVFASTAFLPTGAEVAVAGGTALANQKVLEAIFGDQAIRTLAKRARDDLLERVGALLDAEAGRYLDRLADVPLAAGAGQRLREAVGRVADARVAAGLTAPPAAGSATPAIEPAAPAVPAIEPGAAPAVAPTHPLPGGSAVTYPVPPPRVTVTFGEGEAGR